MGPYPEDLEKAVAFHGHLCPGLLIGYRAARIGLARLGSVRAEDEEVIAIVENNSCAVDAVQVLTGATFGKGNLFFRDYGKQVFTFALRPSGKAWRVSLRADAFAAGAGREERVARLLSAADEELFFIAEKTLSLPAEAQIRPSVVCDNCGEPVMDTRTQKRNGRRLCLPCAEKI